MPSRGRIDHRSALGYKQGALVAIELDHDAFPDSARVWADRGYEVEIVTEREALARWDREVRNVVPSR